MSFFDNLEGLLNNAKEAVKDAIEDKIEEESNKDVFEVFERTAISARRQVKYAFIPSQSDTFQRYIPIISPVDDKPWKVRKKKSIKSIEEKCIICMEINQIPVQRVTSSCEHDRSICEICLQDYIKTKCEKPVQTEIECPHFECKAILGYENVLDYSTDKDFSIYDKELAHKAAEKDESFVWCTALNCRSGQFHPSGSDNPKVECHVCNEVTCFIHRIRWHEGMTCDEYDRNNENERRTADLFRTSKIFRSCPGCPAKVEKTDGCDHMTCKICEHEFCWQCLAPYGGSEGINLIGNTAHDRSCRHYA